MAKCRICKKDIPDGAQYCDSCITNKDDKADESYLDSLLNSVKDVDVPAFDNYKKKTSHAEPEEPEPNIDPEFLVQEADISDILASVDLEALVADSVTREENRNENEDLNSSVDEAEYSIMNESGQDAMGEAIRVTNEAEHDDVNNGKLEAEYSAAYEPADNSDIEAADTSSSGTGEEDDILSLLSQFSPDDPIAKDARAISSMLQGRPIEEEPELPQDVGKVFSDALKVVSSLEDEIDEEVSVFESEEQAKLITEHKEKKKAKKAKKQKTEDNEPERMKKGVFKKLFGNVKDEKTASASLAGLARTDTAVRALDETSVKGMEEVSARASEGTSVKEMEAGKRRRKKSKDKGKPVSAEAEEEIRPGRRARIEEEEQPAKEDKKAKKALKKKKQEKKKEEIKVIEELETDEGRINRVGASIVFLFFGILVMLLLIGTNIFSYSLSIKNAGNYFERRKYTEAYNEVYGMEFKDEDIELYDKIMTVMFVNKQLNSYNHYYAMEKYPEAMDSLLKGLARYDKYIELATILGIKSDLDYVREQILAELDYVFNLSEDEAMDILACESRTEYSIKIYDTILENR